MSKAIQVLAMAAFLPGSLAACDGSSTVTISGIADSTFDYPFDVGFEPKGFGWPDHPMLHMGGGQCPDFTVTESVLNGEYTATGIVEQGYPVYSRELKSGQTLYLYYDAYNKYTDSVIDTRYSESYGWAIGPSIGRSCTKSQYLEGSCSFGYCCDKDSNAAPDSYCCLNGNSGCSNPWLKQTSIAAFDSATACLPSTGINDPLDNYTGGGTQDWRFLVNSRKQYEGGSSSGIPDGYSYNGNSAYECYAWFNGVFPPPGRPGGYILNTAVNIQCADGTNPPETEAPTNPPDTEAPTNPPCNNPSSCSDASCCDGFTCVKSGKGRRATYSCQESNGGGGGGTNSCSDQTSKSTCQAAGCSWNKRRNTCN